MLLERDAELGAVARLVDATVAGQGGVLVIEGPAGIGKTGLLEAASERAVAAGARVLLARATTLESEFAFGVVRGLFEPLLVRSSPAERAALLEGPARLAAPVVVLDGAGEPRAVGTVERLHGLYWLTANLAETGPVVLLVDDAHWADAVSLRALAYLAHRIADLPVGLVVATRTPSGSEPLAALAAMPATTVLRPLPLGAASTERLVAETLGPHPDPAFTAACHEATGGNPLLLRALLTALHRSGVAPDRAGTAAVAERAPAIAATWVLPRLRQLPPAAAALARAVAVLGPGAAVRHAAALADLAPADAVDAADALAEAGLLAPGRHLTFTHPLVAQVVCDHMSRGELDRGHRQAARLAVEDGPDFERAAGHLLVVEAVGDPWTVEVLRSAARAASAKGAPQAAATSLRRALLEPPELAARVALLAELGQVEMAFAPTAGVATLERALAATEDATARARLALTVSRLSRSVSDFRTARRFVHAAAAHLDEVAADVRHDLEVEQAFLDWLDPGARAGVVRRLHRLREQEHPSGPSEVNLLLLLAFDAMEAGEATSPQPETARELALAAVRRHGTLERPEPGILPAALTVLVALDELAGAVLAADEAIAAARTRHLVVQVGETATFRAMAHHRAGRLAEAEADARLAHGLARELESASARRHTLTWLLRCLVERGQLEEADEALDQAGPQRSMPYLAEARGHLRAAQGRYAEALAEFRLAGERARVQLRHPALVTWQPAAALALHHLGRDDEAQREADAAVDTARRHASDRALGLALGARGLVAGAEGDLRVAVETLARVPARLDHARALVDLGAALRRGNARAEARSHLERGMDGAAACGADALVARAAQELAALGARPRRAARTGPEALTPSERRIVTLAVDGLTNRAIAQHLFVTTKTVETHLAAAYRKLGITGRGELLHRLP